ncbi:MAG: 30S ribosomal protein S4 [Sulfobacillus thermosulfidooxidans]|uniref:Small ribosomal subunit protein uS4 n=1 Tax=Sulfobacillus thermotolerans TaxID=338644 RepID=A0ABM6RNN6_9FIRM|nr:30S ribosomal protein S4 [Sulfobacillus sp. hq2]AUW92964.1 30S ribosomal protein S4 [Sulfobacillus thermotolerans]MCY0907111.1 30S ribosomal protein S4 [Sulfobacillus thermotolerans]POB11173.1 30S ribosomal protein S4 [Sulfobacillus sp. hq2]PSR37214.1 MAG: 30S ribosomal protein S4 [Sulfobacillus thermosulfidooxidans]
MARYTGPACRLCRREGVKLYLKGDKCFTDKCPVTRRAYPPGQHGQGRRKLSEYGVQLREKQKARRTYGIMEGQFSRYFEKASAKTGVTGELLLQLLERRLDNVVYRMGFASSRAEARQLVRHNHFAVNGRRVNIPSFSVKPGDVVEVREGSRQKPRFKALLESPVRTIPAWLEVQREELKGTVVRMPNRDEIDTPVQEQLIIEYYSR